MKTSNVLVDTSIILDGVENLTTLGKDFNIFITDIVLRELDGNKGAEGSKGYNAREFFRQFNGHSFKTLDAMPLTNKPLAKNDTLTEGSIDSGAHVYTLSRKWYRAKDINDTKIIEIAKDYDLTLNTLDQAQCARAKSQGIEGRIVSSSSIQNQNARASIQSLGAAVTFQRTPTQISATIIKKQPKGGLHDKTLYIIYLLAGGALMVYLEGKINNTFLWAILFMAFIVPLFIYGDHSDKNLNRSNEADSDEHDTRHIDFMAITHGGKYGDYD